jgi:hypothetical protein
LIELGSVCTITQALPSTAAVTKVHAVANGRVKPYHLAYGPAGKRPASKRPRPG